MLGNWKVLGAKMKKLFFLFVLLQMIISKFIFPVYYEHILFGSGGDFPLLNFVSSRGCRYLNKYKYEKKTTKHHMTSDPSVLKKQRI
jgi:hypothetical protein